MSLARATRPVELGAYRLEHGGAHVDAAGIPAGI